MLLPFDMNMLKSGLVELISNQLSDTTQSDLSEASHSMRFKDLGLPGPNVHARGRFAVTHHHQMWGFLFPVYYYLLETGDFSFMDTVLPYIDGQQATVWEHIGRAIDITTKGISDRGLPRIPKNVGDWMDEFTKISAGDHAESEMMAGELAYVLKGFAEIAVKQHRDQDAKKWMAIYERLKKAVNELAWDGEWYIRAFSDRADPPIPVGTHNNQEGRIYLNAQSWPVISGIAPPDRARRSMESVKKYLMSDYGPMVFYPSYSHYVDYIGTQSIYAPGFRNACIYLRPVGWAIIAACLNGQAELANEMYDKASLPARGKDMEHFHCEPYVYPENYDGPDHRLRGQGEFQWNLGEGAAWMWVAYVDYILGIRPVPGGLLIDPHIPPAWDGYRVKRIFRGNTFDIEFRNPRHVSMGVSSVYVNGKKIKGNLLAFKAEGKTFQIKVVL
jgi:cellobiose phosphorylase